VQKYEKKGFFLILKSFEVRQGGKLLLGVDVVTFAGCKKAVKHGDIIGCIIEPANK